MKHGRLKKEISTIFVVGRLRYSKAGASILRDLIFPILSIILRHFNAKSTIQVAHPSVFSLFLDNQAENSVAL